MAGNASRLNIVDLESSDGTDLGEFDVVEVDVVTGGVENGEEENRVGELAMHPEILIEREEANLGSQPAHNSATDGEEDEHAVDAENKTGTSGDPYREFEGV